MSGHYEIVFTGEVYASVDPLKVRADMAQLFRQPEEKVDRLFDGRTWVLKDGLDRPTAERYQVELAKIGVISELRDRSPKIRTDMPADPHAKSQNFTLESVAITRMKCPECDYEQLDADYCARCGVNIQVAKAKAKLRAKEDEVIQARIQALRNRNEDGAPPSAPAAEPVRQPQGMVKESTLEFRGHKSTNPLLWVAVTVVVIAVVLGALVASGVLSFSV